jgi:CrcB protein
MKLKRQMVLMTLVACGAAAGTALRYLFLTYNQGVDQAAIVFLLNSIGATIFGFWFALSGRAPRGLVLFFCAGFSGGLTTFSSYAVDVANFIDQGRLQSAGALSLATPVFCVLFAGFGFRVGRLAT